jgi:hypothetical protein
MTIDRKQFFKTLSGGNTLQTWSKIIVVRPKDEKYHADKYESNMWNYTTIGAMKKTLDLISRDKTFNQEELEAILSICSKKKDGTNLERFQVCRNDMMMAGSFCFQTLQNQRNRLKSCLEEHTPTKQKEFDDLKLAGFPADFLKLQPTPIDDVLIHQSEVYAYMDSLELIFWTLYYLEKIITSLEKKTDVIV